MKTLLLLISLALLAGMAQANPNELSVWESVDLASVNGNEVTPTRTVWEAVDTARALDYTTWQATGYQPPLTPQNEYRSPYDAFTVAAYPPFPPATYFPPVYYTATYPPQSAQSVTNWLFGTHRQPSAPMNETEAHAEQAEPTPPPVATVAVEPVIIRPATMQAGVIAAPVIAPQTRQVEERDTTTSALPDMTMWEIINYWTRKVVMTGLLLIMIGFAWYKEHTAKHQASRRLADLEHEMQRLDRLIYGSASLTNPGDDRRGGNRP